MASIDYFNSFPHLAAAIAPLSNSARVAYSERNNQNVYVADNDLAKIDYILPSAACYGIYFDLRGSTIPNSLLITTRSRCYRNERHHEGLKRLWAFQMREIVYLGSSDGARQHLDYYKENVFDFASRLGIPLTLEPASDPFFRRDDPRLLLQRLEPVKWEFIYNDCAIASINFHRNFFGDRCEIILPTGEPVFTSCVAFGLERWLHALSEVYRGDISAAMAAVVAATS